MLQQRRVDWQLDMAPPFKQVPVEDQWWRNAYFLHENIIVQYELEFGEVLITPGTKVKIKNTRGVFKFRCLAHNTVTDTTWIDCIDLNTGEWKSFHLAKLKGPVVQKKRRGRKKVVRL